MTGVCILDLSYVDMLQFSRGETGSHNARDAGWDEVKSGTLRSIDCSALDDWKTVSDKKMARRNCPWIDIITAIQTKLYKLEFPDKTIISSSARAYKRVVPGAEHGREYQSNGVGQGDDG